MIHGMLIPSAELDSILSRIMGREALSMPIRRAFLSGYRTEASIQRDSSPVFPLPDRAGLGHDADTEADAESKVRFF